jgi:hypothetical protein
VKHKTCPLCSAVVFSVPCPLNSSTIHYTSLTSIFVLSMRLMAGCLKTFPRPLAVTWGKGGHAQCHCVGAAVRCDHLTHQTAVATTSGVRSEYWERCANVQRCSTWRFVSRVRNKGWIVMQDEEIAHMLYVMWLSAVKGRVRLKLAYMLYKTLVVIECLCLYRAFLFQAKQL